MRPARNGLGCGKKPITMKQLISKLPGLRAADKPVLAEKKSAGSSPEENQDNRHSIEDDSDNGIRRQLIQMLLRDGLRKCGIPPDWVECQMMVVNSRSRGPGMYVRLVMRHWDLSLLTYAHAFQQQLLAAITQFEPQASGWLHGFLWEFDVGDTCPYLDMPDPAVWRVALPPAKAATAALPAGAVAGADAEVLQDLQRMFAIRDANIEQQAFANTVPIDFQNTEPARPP